jgi:hypothetical protein
LTGRHLVVACFPIVASKGWDKAPKPLAVERVPLTKTWNVYLPSSKQTDTFSHIFSYYSLLLIGVLLLTNSICRVIHETLIDA